MRTVRSSSRLPRGVSAGWVSARTINFDHYFTREKFGIYLAATYVADGKYFQLFWEIMIKVPTVRAGVWWTQRTKETPRYLPSAT